jgi:hypothetical protein
MEGMPQTMLWTRDVYPGSRIRFFFIPDPELTRSRFPSETFRIMGFAVSLSERKISSGVRLSPRSFRLIEVILLFFILFYLSKSVPSLDSSIGPSGLQLFLNKINILLFLTVLSLSKTRGVECGSEAMGYRYATGSGRIRYNLYNFGDVLFNIVPKFTKIVHLANFNILIF